MISWAFVCLSFYIFHMCIFLLSLCLFSPTTTVDIPFVLYQFLISLFFCHSFSFGFLVLTYIPVQVNIYIYIYSILFFPPSSSLLNNWTSYPVGDGETYGNGWMIWLSYISCFYKVYLGNTHANEIWKRPALIFHI